MRFPNAFGKPRFPLRKTPRLGEVRDIHSTAVSPAGRDVTADHGCQYSAKAELAYYSWPYSASRERDPASAEKAERPHYKIL